MLNSPPNNAPPWVTGRYYLTPSGTTSTSAVLGNGTVRAAPFYVPNAVTLTRLGGEVATTIGEAGSKFRPGIWADDGTGRPGALLVDGGALVGDVLGAKEATISLSLAPGWYWAGAAVQGAPTTQPTLRTLTALISSVMDVGAAAPTISAPPVCWISATAVATLGTALPDPFGASSQSTTIAPRLFVKV